MNTECLYSDIVPQTEHCLWHSIKIYAGKKSIERERGQLEELLFHTCKIPFD